MKIDFTKTAEDISCPVLRILYFEHVENEIFDTIEVALNKANFSVEVLGGGEYKNGHEFVSGNNDFFIQNYENFDIEFCREIINSIVNFKFELELFESDPFINTIVSA